MVYVAQNLLPREPKEEDDTPSSPCVTDDACHGALSQHLAATLLLVLLLMDMHSESYAPARQGGERRAGADGAQTEIQKRQARDAAVSVHEKAIEV